MIVIVASHLNYISCNNTSSPSFVDIPIESSSSKSPPKLSSRHRHPPPHLIKIGFVSTSFYLLCRRWWSCQSLFNVKKIKYFGHYRLYSSWLFKTLHSECHTSQFNNTNWLFQVWDEISVIHPKSLYLCLLRAWSFTETLWEQYKSLFYWKCKS